MVHIAKVSVKRTFPKQLSSLELVFDFMEEFAESLSLDKTLRRSIMVAVEELFINFVKYNTDSCLPVCISFEHVDRAVVVRMIDYGVTPWDVTHHVGDELEQPIERRRAGGMGLHLVRQLVDSFEYEHVDGNSIVTLRKRIGSEDV